MSDRWRLLLLSALMLFVELAIIRWTGANVVYLSYFSNFVLLGSFLGIGLGFLRARRERDLWPYAPVALAALVAFVTLFPVEIDRSGGELIYFGSLRPSGLPIWLTLPFVFLAAAAVMTFVAEGVARTFVRFEPLEAYRLDILGAIAGIAGFSLLSFLHAPPVVWGLVAAGLFLVLHPPRRRGAVGGWLAVVVVLLALESLSPGVSWSPYYEVTVDPVDRAPARVSVNGIPHQAIQPTARRLRTEPIYLEPYRRLTTGAPRDVLVVGAGNGTDVAIALRQGAGHVDAVEIDPRLHELGAELHPERPYDDPRVDVHVTDGRAFLEATDRRYDLILFALPDSLTLVSGQANLRLESYLFTVEAIAEARAHLTERGAFAMYNYYREPWLVDRLGATLDDVFGQAPCIEDVGGEGRLAMLMASNDPDALACPTTWAARTVPVPEPVRDDAPFLYLRGRSVPGFYLATIGFVLAAAALLVRGVAGPLRTLTGYLDLALMGAAFLLLETMNVVQFALLFGTTWFVNALVFAGILLSVYLAVEVAKRVRFRRPGRLYAALAAALAVAFAVPPQELLEVPPVPRFAAAAVLAFAPVFLANLVFAERFARVGASAVAFGANLLGAMVGGVLEYASLVVGYRALLVVAGLLYGAAFLAGRRHLVAAPARAPGHEAVLSG